MNRTSRLTCFLLSLAIISLVCSSALAQIHVLPSSVRGDSDFAESGLTSLPQSMLKGSAELQAYRRLARLQLTIEVDDPTMAPCSTAIIVDPPADLASALSSEHKSGLLGLDGVTGDFAPPVSPTLTVPKRPTQSSFKSSLRGRVSRQMLSVR
jgi:hypothetical protein